MNSRTYKSLVALAFYAVSTVSQAYDQDLVGAAKNSNVKKCVKVAVGE